MSDLISRQAAIDALGERPIVWMDSDYEIAQRNQWDADKLAIETVPSAQPEIIRCKDCKHQIKEWREDKRLKENGYWVYACKVISNICGYWAGFGQDNEFCSDAERRTDE